jgi:hypothetical protein
MAYSSTAPGRWYTLSDEERAAGRLEGELCVLADGACFVRANLEVPVNDGNAGPLVFSSWVQVAPEVLRTLLERWDEPDRASDPAFPGALANDLPGYPGTIGLEVELHTAEPGTRARAVPVPSDHPLAVDHWEGSNSLAVQSLAEILAHPET